MLSIEHARTSFEAERKLKRHVRHRAWTIACGSERLSWLFCKYLWPSPADTNVYAFSFVHHPHARNTCVYTRACGQVLMLAHM